MNTRHTRQPRSTRRTKQARKEGGHDLWIPRSSCSSSCWHRWSGLIPMCCRCCWEFRSHVMPPARGSLAGTGGPTCRTGVQRHRVADQRVGGGHSGSSAQHGEGSRRGTRPRRTLRRALAGAPLRLDSLGSEELEENGYLWERHYNERHALPALDDRVELADGVTTRGVGRIGRLQRHGFLAPSGRTVNEVVVRRYDHVAWPSPSAPAWVRSTTTCSAERKGSRTPCCRSCRLPSDVA
jgi:hypothetical protein